MSDTDSNTPTETDLKNATPTGASNSPSTVDQHTDQEKQPAETGLQLNDEMQSEAGTSEPMTTPKKTEPGVSPPNCILFYGVTYLGCASVNAPKSEAEINRIMATLNEQCKLSIEVAMSVPQHIENKITLIDTLNDTVITEYKMTHVLFVVRGQKSSPESSCFAFTTCQGDSPENFRFSCHVFRCNLADAVSKILYSFWTVFNRQQQKQEPPAAAQIQVQKRTTSESSTGQFTSVATSIFGSLNFSAASFASSIAGGSNSNPNNPYSQEFSEFALNYTNGKLEDQYIFRAILDIKEEDPKNPGNFISVPKDKETFKLRKNLDKQIIITIQQLTNQTLEIERCFGVLMCPGRNVSHKDMQLLQTISMGKSNTYDSNVSNNYFVSASWDIQDTSAASSLQVLNDETQKEMRVFMTVAVDLVINGLADPVRFCIETKARIYSQNEKFWVYNKSRHFEEFYLQIKNNSVRTTVSATSPASPVNPNNMFSLDSIHSQTELTRKKNVVESTAVGAEVVGTALEANLSDEENEPIVSGCGSVTKECGEEELLDWSDLLSRWRMTTWNERPKGLQSLVRKGIPEALRGEVWQLLAGCNENEKSMNESYRLLLSKESPSESIIVRDINRTFTGHQFFQDENGQQALYKLSKAYSIYDEEVGYCQGLSFLVASLLLHVPEEQAFNLLVKIMYRYELREIYKTNFEALHLRFYQLESLIREHLPQLYEHFIDLNIEAHMYASQWFLTLYTAKFPLNMVFRILDLFLSEGILVIFSVALSLLKNSQRDLLALDFEGILKYFRVTMPKKYRQEQHFKDLMNIWTNLNTKITNKKLKKYEKSYMIMKEEEALKEDPAIRFERECKKLNLTLRRLEQENDDLANEYIESKISLSKQLDEYKDEYEVSKTELTKSKTDYQNKLNDLQDTNKKLVGELEQLKKIWRRQSDKYEGELERNTIIITEYKQICNTLSNKVEKWTNYKKKFEAKIKKLSLCEACTEANKIDTDLLNISDTNPPTENNSSSDLNALAKSYSSDSSTSSQLSNEPNDDKSDQTTRSSIGQSDTEAGRVKHLELELARVKLELVDAQCRNQEFDHILKGYENNQNPSGSNFNTRMSRSSIDYDNQMSSSTSSLNNKNASNGSIYSGVNGGQSNGNSWLSKTFTQFKEAKNHVVLKAQKVKIPSTELN